MSDHEIRGGAYPILLTAFDEDDQLDLPVIGALLDFYRELGLPGVLALGQASEMLWLNDDERLRVAEYVAEYPRGDLLAATVGNFGISLAEQARSLQAIHDMGAEVVVVALALLPSAEGLGQQLLELGDLVKPEVRLGVYEIPQPEHRLLSPAEVGAVARSGRYYFMKDTCRRLEPFGEKVKAAASSNLKIYQANLAVLPPSMEAGGNGFCGWLPIVAPELCEQVCDLSLPAELRRRAHDKLMAFNEVMIAQGFPASAKYILARRGLAIQPFSREPAARKFFERDRADLDAFIDAEQPFRPITLAKQA